MSIVNLGKIGLNIVGLHVQSNVHYRLDVVQDNQTKIWYIAYSFDVPANIPLTNAGYWTIFFDGAMNEQQITANAQNITAILTKLDKTIRYDQRGNKKFEIVTTETNDFYMGYWDNGWKKSISVGNTSLGFRGSDGVWHEIATKRNSGLIQSGSNANGRWTKYPDRTLIQSGVYTTNSDGNGWVNMPTDFNSTTWRIFFTPVQTGFGVSITLNGNKSNKHTATIKSRKSATNEQIPVSMDWIAIGRY